ncbi:ArsR family transcriptional regulator [Burkholderia thailandensis]|uniref:ArsR/SmtB family transcription factor n=1 Tax=Burkholderia thailandensis TaxID=57975 RepID=UPI00036ACB8A|nr:helix-turn-helix transcriptional regulator [Burkholderia thailandensis]MCS3394038.1 ArsR family transcriptional regulator [Burkholderia thailandensis]MCS6427141.1 ArsR family transcriptional regulator [Burkholderia thailandensis]MCS6455411.1 ArsR family transcriptional regulator [Burkholderia thailandensis]MCS6466362.1 ArsR family transcriptional regulator [Burkholderia thailandensis]MCS6485009.1 ArsR family transcriptional regulator [Burkholderia thailandensis]
MDDTPDIPRVARLLADAARTRIVWTLIDGSARAAGELAYHADISAQSASAHLMKLVAGGLLAAESQGRHRYFRIANAEVACMIESMAALASGTELGLPKCLPSTRSSTEAFMYARTCYDHLAGELAVGVLASMRKARWLERKDTELIVTRSGERQLRVLGIDLASAQGERRVFARPCADLTQRHPHLGGALGTHMLKLYIDQCWIVRSPKSRLVSVTPKGNEMFRRLLELA